MKLEKLFPIILASSCIGAGVAYGHGSHGHSDSAPLAEKMVSKSEAVKSADPSFSVNGFTSRSENLRTSSLEANAPKSETTVGLGLDYAFSNSVSLGMAAEYLSTEKMQDPSLSLLYAKPIASETMFLGALSATAPVSNSSKEQGKITNLRGNAGIAYKANAKWSLNSSVLAGYSTYSGKALPSHDTHGAQHAPNAAENDGTGIDPVHHAESTSTGASGDHHEDTLPEQYRYGASFGGRYQISKAFRYEIGYALNRINRHYSAGTWSSELTAGRLSYTARPLSLFLGLSLHKENHQFMLPSFPVAKAGLTITL